MNHCFNTSSLRGQKSIRKSLVDCLDFLRNCNYIFENSDFLTQERNILYCSNHRKGPSINYVSRRGGSAKCLCYYISLCSKLAYEGGWWRRVKKLQNLAYVVYGCTLIVKRVCLKCIVKNNITFAVSFFFNPIFCFIWK